MGIILLIVGYVARRWTVLAWWLAAYVVASVGVALVRAEPAANTPWTNYLQAILYLGAMALVYGIVLLALGRGVAALVRWVRGGAA